MLYSIGKTVEKASMPELNKKIVCIEVATPPKFPTGIEGTWSPEYLLLVMFDVQFLAIAENEP
jgi:hypothetical protein